MKGFKNNNPFSLRKKYQEFVARFKRLQGDPHYIALGMAIGVFVAITPTIPFHTILALAFAFVLRGSKAACIIGVWFSNPVTIPFLYIWCYKLGMMVIGKSYSDLPQIITLYETLESSIPLAEKYREVSSFLLQHFVVAYAMLIGGVLLGIPSAIFTYIITRKFFTVIRNRKDAKREKEISSE